MDQEKKHELSELLSEAMQHIDIQSSGKRPNINVDRYKQILHNEWVKSHVSTITESRGYQPYITEETINVNLLNFMKDELSKYINVDDHIAVFPDWHNCEFHHLRTQLLRITICFGIEYAVNEFNRCLTENSGSIQPCTILKGISVDNEIQILDQIRLFPLPSSRRGGDVEQVLSKEILCKMPDFLIKSQFNSRDAHFILGGVLAVMDLTYSPIFVKPQRTSEPYDPLHRSSKVIKLDRDIQDKQIDALCSALSLTLNTNVGTSTSWIFHDPHKFSNVSGIKSSSCGGNVRGLYGPTETFGIDQVGEFQYIFNKLYTGVPENINRAIGRWLESKGRRNPIDIMIDLRIALEALYLADQTSLEMSYRLSTRAAWHLGQKVEDRKKLQKFFKTIYEISSSSVHSESINDSKIRKVTNLDKTEFITKSQDLCRNAILKFLKSEKTPKKKEDWSDYWSDLTLGGETFK